MEITREALVLVIKAARAAKKLADNIRCLSNGGMTGNVADTIAEDLADALNMMNGEKLDVDDDFLESKTYEWLFKCSVPDDRIAGEFIRMANENLPKQPKPNLISRVQFQDMVNKFGGYSAQTPEGEWK